MSAAREIVLIHGGGVGTWMWRALRGELGRDVPVHTPGFAGHRPGDGSHYAGPRPAARDVAEELGIERRDGLVVVGFSAGGQVALELAASHPERVAALVIVSTLVEPLPGRGVLAAIGAATAPLARSPGFARRQAAALGIPPEDVADYVSASVAFSTESFRRLLRTNFAYRPPAGVVEYDRPLLLMAGSREQRAVRTGMRRLAERAPSARYMEVQGAGHDIPLRHPAVLAGELRRIAFP